MSAFACDYSRQYPGDAFRWIKGPQGPFYGRNLEGASPVMREYVENGNDGRFAAPVRIPDVGICKANGRCDGLHNCTSRACSLRMGEQTKQFTCLTCGAGYVVENAFNTHVSTCGDKKHKCTHCAAAFRQKCDLERHLRTHTREKPYKCNQCPRAFAQPTGLSIHLVTHGGESNSHKCVACGSTFKHKTGLVRHRKKGSNRCYPTAAEGMHVWAFVLSFGSLTLCPR